MACGAALKHLSNDAFPYIRVALHNPREHSSACTSRCVPSSRRGARDSYAKPRNKILLESNGLSALRRAIVNAASLALGKQVAWRHESGEIRRGGRTGREMEPSAIRGFTTIDYR